MMIIYQYDVNVYIHTDVTVCSKETLKDRVVKRLFVHKE